MKRSDPDYVTGRRGRYEVQPPIVHPAYCVCERCETTRDVDEWGREVVHRIRRKSPHPNSRVDSAAYARNLKVEIEARLREAVEEAHAKGHALGPGVTFGDLCDAYRRAQQEDGKRYDRSRYVIAAVESSVGRERDAESIDVGDHDRVVSDAAGLSPQTKRHRSNTLVAIMNHAVRDRLIPDHRLRNLRRPKVPRTGKPVTFTDLQVAVLLGPALDRYEQEQARWNATLTGAQERKQLSLCPLRGFCLVAYYTLMRPENNFGLRWEQLTIHPMKDHGAFRLEWHKNADKGIVVEGALHPELVRYLRPLIPPGPKPAGLVHPSPLTGEPWSNYRKQWARLVAIANEILPDEQQMEGKRAEFYTWRHTGASHLARITNPVEIGRLMGDVSLKTIMDHYFDASVDRMRETMERWEVPGMPERIEGDEGRPN